MFTGIIEEIGKINNIIRNKYSVVLDVACTNILEDTKIGDSISVNGVCLTVTSHRKNQFTADVMHETLNKSSLGSLSIGSHVNLERAMSINARFGGHIVSGHIDGTGYISNIKNDDNAVWYTIKCNSNLLKYMIKKGSITIDGISLTIANISEEYFEVSIIPHTLSKTILAERKIGDIVNLENDCIGKYVERLMDFKDNKKEISNINKDFLIENGFF